MLKVIYGYSVSYDYRAILFDKSKQIVINFVILFFNI